MTEHQDDDDRPLTVEEKLRVVGLYVVLAQVISGQRA